METKKITLDDKQRDWLKKILKWIMSHQGIPHIMYMNEDGTSDPVFWVENPFELLMKVLGQDWYIEEDKKALNTLSMRYSQYLKSGWMNIND